jgi:hypothetical protein
LLCGVQSIIYVQTTANREFILMNFVTAKKNRSLASLPVHWIRMKIYLWWNKRIQNIQSGSFCYASLIVNTHNAQNFFSPLEGCENNILRCHHSIELCGYIKNTKWKWNHSPLFGYEQPDSSFLKPEQYYSLHLRWRLFQASAANRLSQSIEVQRK